MATSLSVLIERATPVRGSYVIHRLPSWLVGALNDSFPAEKLRNLEDVSSLLHRLERQAGCRFLDHAGSDMDGNFVAEPYGRNCAICQTAAKKFAGKLGLRLKVSTQTFHAHGSDECIRFIFCKPAIRW